VFVAIQLIILSRRIWIHYWKRPNYDF